MKVYLIRKISGEYDNYRNNIIGVYLDKNKCEADLSSLINKEENNSIEDMLKGWVHYDIEYHSEEIESDKIFC